MKDLSFKIRHGTEVFKKEEEEDGGGGNSNVQETDLSLLPPRR